ncbi:MAG TPA: CvpA family protein [Bacillota bacterium]|nr:CvpA family protein [Bacillota bacterium]
MNWLDWLIVVILAFFALQGLRCGLVAGIAKLAGTLAGILVAYSYYGQLAEYFSTQWNLDEKLLPLAGSLLKFWLPSKNATPPLTYGKPAAEFAALNQPGQLGDYLAQIFASGILEAISFLLLLFFTAWAVNLAGRVFTKIADFSFLGPLNRLGGLFFGLAEGLIVVMIVITLMAPFQRPEFQKGWPQSPAPQATAFQGSRLLPYFEPLFEAINRPLQLQPPQNYERVWPAGSI